MFIQIVNIWMKKINIICNILIFNNKKMSKNLIFYNWIIIPYKNE